MMMDENTENNKSQVFPNLFVETVQPTIASIMVFAFADLRRIARETDNDLQSDGNSKKVLDLPIAALEMLNICTDNQQVLQQEFRANEYETLEYIVGEFREQYGDIITNVNHVTIHHIGDDNALHECVHAIIVDSRKQQITLTFRGSITMQDWITDAKLVTGDIVNPLYDNDNDDDNEHQPKYVGVHLGFRDYLYDVHDPLLPQISLEKIQSKMKSEYARAVGATPSTNDYETFQKPTRKNKIDVILDQVQGLMDANPGYKLYIVGHSLGGALALLMSLQAAVQFATCDIPVTCVTIANPRVGDNRFRGAIQYLEKQKKLRCLTVHNFMDIVPSMPNRLCRGDFCRPNQFCLSGMQMILKERSFTTKYHSEMNDTKWQEFQGEFRRYLIVVFCWIQMAKQHNYRLYLDRLVAQKDKLSTVYLNDLYRKEGIDFD